MTTNLSEDDLYRTSTQYRLWSFAPEQLAAQRRKTHELAIARAKQYLSQQNGASNGDATPECLMEQEELRLVQRYCDVIIATAKHLKWPSNIYTTAVQYLKRFYLSNSCMTYPPKEIYKTVLFLASKTEAYHVTLSQFSRSISADPEAVLTPEYKVMQALRFTLDVRQPFRGLKGALMELLNMAEGLIDSIAAQQKTGQEVQQGLMDLEPPESANTTQWRPQSSTTTKEQVVERIQLAYQAAKDILDTAASLTDAYFLYTPSQILLASLRIADTPLLTFYLDSKLSPNLATRPKILATVEACSELLASHDPKGSMSKEERAELEKKLEGCRDPATRDLVKSAQAMREGGGQEEDEEKVKKRKAERERDRKEMDDLFGPSLKG